MSEPEVKPEVKPEPAPAPEVKGMSTTTKVAIGVGAVLALGCCYYAYTKWSAPDIQPEQSI